MAIVGTGWVPNEGEDRINEQIWDVDHTIALITSTHTQDDETVVYGDLTRITSGDLAPKTVAAASWNHAANPATYPEIEFDLTSGSQAGITGWAVYTTEGTPRIVMMKIYDTAITIDSTDSATDPLKINIGTLAS